MKKFCRYLNPNYSKHVSHILPRNTIGLVATGGSSSIAKINHPQVKVLFESGVREVLAFDNEAEKQFSGMEHVERISNAMKEWHGEFKKTETEDPTLIALGYSTGSWMLNRWWYDKRPSFAKSNSICISIGTSLSPKHDQLVDFILDYWTPEAVERDAVRKKNYIRDHGDNWPNVTVGVGKLVREGATDIQNSIYFTPEEAIQFTSQSDVYVLYGEKDVLLQHSKPFCLKDKSNYFELKGMDHFDVFSMQPMVDGGAPPWLRMTCFLKQIFTNVGEYQPLPVQTSKPKEIPPQGFDEIPKSNL